MKLIHPAYFLFLLVALFFASCDSGKTNPPQQQIPAAKSTTISFPFFLAEKTMIVNQEQTNEIEGHYLKVLEAVNDSVLTINLPDNFSVDSTNYTHWMIGWPTGKAYYDAGCENLRAITKIDLLKKQVTLGKLLRGNGSPVKNQRVVFWDRTPSGFETLKTEPLVRPELWKDFSGKSMEFGAIIFDSLRRQWIMYVQEVDTVSVQIFAATSTDLLHWKAYNNGHVFFKPDNFSNTNWAGKAEDGKTPQTARLYSALFYKDQWFFFLSGYGKNGFRHIGLITAPDPLKGPFKFHEEPLLSPGNSYDSKGCFYPKICQAGDHFLLYYDGVDASGIETVCMAESENLYDWKKYAGNPVLSDHYGWRSGVLTSEPDYVYASKDSVWLMAGGYKKYNTEFTKEDSLRGRVPKDTSIFNTLEAEKGRHISGNVMDAQLGVFLSTDKGHHFKPYVNNPVWLCDYADTLQNDHCGGDFYFTNYKDKRYIIYQAKSETQHRYNILLRQQ